MKWSIRICRCWWSTTMTMQKIVSNLLDKFGFNNVAVASDGAKR